MIKHFYTSMALFAGLLTSAGCAQTSQEVPEAAIVEAADDAEAGKAGHDMKAMFGPDYKKGDIGHSNGIVKSVDPETDFMVIDHGPVHGTPMGPMTMAFETVGDVDVSLFEAGDEVEFLVRLEDGSYNIFVICDTVADGPGCLDAKLGQ